MPRDSDSRRREIRSRDYSEERDRDKYSSRSSKSKKSSSSRRYKSPDERSSKTSRRRRRKSSSSDTSSSSDSESSGKSEKFHRKSEKSIKVPTILPPVIEKKFEIDLFDIPARPEIFEQINADEFVPKLFAPKKLPESIKIDLDLETISVPKVESAETEEDTLFHKNLFGDDSVRMDKWVRKLFLYRQKMISSS